MVTVVQHLWRVATGEWLLPGEDPRFCCPGCGYYAWEQDAGVDHDGWSCVDAQRYTTLDLLSWALRSWWHRMTR